MTGNDHVAALVDTLARVQQDAARIDRWGRQLAKVLLRGGRLLAAGNGGSAAEAQHLTAELVGRYRDDRPAFSALALHAETSSLTAITNDYGPERAFARQVEAHGRRGDLLLLLSTSGRSRNILAAARTGRERGLRVWGMTGPAPNPLTMLCDDAVAIDAPATATVQEAHLVVVHMVCEAFDAAVHAAYQHVHDADLGASA